MKRSESVMEWQAEAEAKARAEAVIQVLQLRFGTDLPAQVEDRIRGATDVEQLKHWLEAAVRARTLNKFRQTLEA